MRAAISCVCALNGAGDTLGGYGSGVLYVFFALTALLIAKPIVVMIGPKLGLFCGTAGYCVYVGGFLFALLVPALAWPVFLIACAIGGIAGGLLWPSQGKYFARNAALYSEAAEIPADQVRRPSLLRIHFVAVVAVVVVYMCCLCLSH